MLCCVDWRVCVRHSVQAQSRRHATQHSSADRSPAAARYRRLRSAVVVPGDGHRQEAAHGIHRDPAAHAGRHLQGDKASEQGDSGDHCRAARSEGVDSRQLLHERSSSFGRQVHGRNAVVVVDVSRRPGQQRGRQQYCPRTVGRRLATVTSAAMLSALSRGWEHVASIGDGQLFECSGDLTSLALASFSAWIVYKVLHFS